MCTLNQNQTFRVNLTLQVNSKYVLLAGDARGFSGDIAWYNKSREFESCYISRYDTL